MTSPSSHSNRTSPKRDTDIFASSPDASMPTKRWSIRNAKIIVPSAMMATVLMIGGGAATASAMSDKIPDTDSVSAEHKAQLEQVMTNKDFQGWQSIMHERIDSVTEDQFNEKADRFAERQTRKAEHRTEMESILRENGISDEDITRLNELREARDFDGLKALHEELGLDDLKDQLKPEDGRKDGPRGDRDGKRGFGGPFGR